MSNPFPEVRRSLLPWTVALVVTLAACGGGEGSAEGGHLTTETVNGVEHTVAADVPELDGGLELLWRAPDQAAVLEGVDWADPTWVAADQDRVAVLDPMTGRVHLFDSEGRRAGSFGRTGQGPGELSRAVSVGLHGDSILVTSLLGHPSLQWFGSDGSYLGSMSDAGVAGAAYFLPGVGIIRQRVSLTAGGSTPEWEFLDLEGVSHPISLPGDHPMQPQVQDGGEGCWHRGPAGPNLVELDCSFPLLRLVDPTGRVLREHRIAQAPRRTPEELMQRAVDQVEAGMRSSSEDVPPEMAARLIAALVERLQSQYLWMPRMARVAGSPSGHRIVAVEQLPEDFGGGPGTLHILADDGRYLARVALPHRVRSVAASNTLLVVMAEDEATGLRHLEAYRLP